MRVGVDVVSIDRVAELVARSPRFSARGYTGAPQLTAMGAARAGAGLVTLCVPEAIYPIVAAGCLEVMPAPLPDGGTGLLRGDGLQALHDRLPTADVLVIGPGLGRAP